jgi:hypothetical protein
MRCFTACEAELRPFGKTKQEDCMKSNKLMCLIVLALCATGAVSARLSAQQQQENAEHKEEPRRYKVIDTGTLGGPSSFLGFEGSRNINNRGTLAAATDTSTPASPPFCLNDCFVSHATIWRNGELIDLGTIPGGSGGTSWISDTGLISGLAFNGLIDPVTGQPELEAVLWKNGGPLNLGTANLEASHRSSARFSNCDCHVKSL